MPGLLRTRHSLALPPWDGNIGVVKSRPTSAGRGRIRSLGTSVLNQEVTVEYQSLRVLTGLGNDTARLVMTGDNKAKFLGGFPDNRFRYHTDM